MEAVCPINQLHLLLGRWVRACDARRPPVSLVEACIGEGVILIPSHFLFYKIPAARLLGRKLVRTLCCYMIVTPFLDFLITPATIIDILL